MFELRDITKTYRPKGQPDVVALDEVSLTLPDKGLAFILGKSGSGKSTLLNILGGLDGYDAGEMAVDGKSTAAFTQAEYDDFRNRYAGIIFQEYNLIEGYTVAQNLSLALELQGAKQKERPRKRKFRARWRRWICRATKGARQVS